MFHRREWDLRTPNAQTSWRNVQSVFWDLQMIGFNASTKQRIFAATSKKTKPKKGIFTAKNQEWLEIQAMNIITEG